VPASIAVGVQAIGPAADASGDGTVDIAEMQNAMSNHLQITP